MTIKQFESNDVIEHRENIASLISETYRANLKFTKESALSIAHHKVDSMIEHLRGGEAFVFCHMDKGQVISIIWSFYKETEYEIGLHVNQLAVNENYRGEGLAKRLLAHTETLAKQYNLSFIDLNVSPENKSAVNLYKSTGYVATNLSMKKKLED